MSKIRSKDTKPELLLRSALFKLGYRYRVHVKDLPGKPDIVFKRQRVAIFVHGCFWHYHSDCREGRIPNTNTAFWKNKLSKNIERDKMHLEALYNLGWHVMVVWECEIEKDLKAILKEIDFQIKLYSSETNTLK
jgi:DNA mismatch endonuclease, patch repair protein